MISGRGLLLFFVFCFLVVELELKGKWQRNAIWEYVNDFRCCSPYILFCFGLLKLKSKAERK